VPGRHNPEKRVKHRPREKVVWKDQGKRIRDREFEDKPAPRVFGEYSKRAPCYLKKERGEKD